MVVVMVGFWQMLVLPQAGACEIAIQNQGGVIPENMGRIMNMSTSHGVAS